MYIINASALYIINPAGIVYHQRAALYLITAQPCIKKTPVFLRRINENPDITKKQKQKKGTGNPFFQKGVPRIKHPNVYCFFSSWYSFSVLTFQTAVRSEEPVRMQLTASNAVTME